ncbi:MAG: alpha-ketoglutarate-dependent dioxygenase AlkB [Candidatus Sericytochromatia bacterium]|nr:alpha-ketoglutarate-dependent dioxygenase AlkB [Candidatus Sericytochromatia bacterium]
MHPALAAWHWPGWLSPPDADRAFAQLLAEIPWQQGQVRLFGKWLNEPRLSAWCGDAESVYTYAGRQLAPLPWHATLQRLRQALQIFLKQPFNSVLLNYYRHGDDSMGYHRDNEPELGPEPVIASLSLGATRRFVLRQLSAPHERIALPLAHGDLLLMYGHSQRDWQHALPKQKRVSAPRLNLTFRYVQTAATQGSPRSV